MGIVDLHAHSTFSDGSDSPEQLAAIARKKGLKALALTDHNTINGLSRFLSAARKEGIEGVPGAEFSTDWQAPSGRAREAHIVGLFIPASRYSDVMEYVSDLANRKKKSNQALEQALREGGYEISLDEMFAAKPKDGQVNRADFARELERKGYMTRAEAFATVLKSGNGFYKAPARLDAMKTIDFIRSVGALPVLAHPYLSLSPQEVELFLEEGVPRGLIAMETFYSTYDEATTRLAKETAERHGVLPSGGSDYHGNRKPDIELGTGRGSLAVPASVLDRLRASLADLREG